MGNELKVEKGDRVASYYPGTEGELRDIYTVITQYRNGIIVVADNLGRGKWQYDSMGWARGRATGRIRKLEEGEEEQFLAARQAELEKIKAERQEKEAKKAQDLETCREWVKTNAWDVLDVKTVNCTLYIVSLPIPTEPCTLLMRFDKQESIFHTKEYGYSVSISIHRTEINYGRISGGQTSANSAEINPLEIAAAWMATWSNLDKLNLTNE